MSAGYTPGPWKPVEFGGVQIGGGRDFAKAVCTMWDSKSAKGKANARLIAAAPDLLEALRMLQRQALQSPDLIATEWGQEALNATAAAIAKAVLS